MHIKVKKKGEKKRPKSLPSPRGRIFINHKIKTLIGNKLEHHKHYVYLEVCMKTIFLSHGFVFLAKVCKVRVRDGKYAI